MAWLDKRVGTEPADFDKWRTSLKELAAQAKDDDAVIKLAPAILAMYSEYVGDANVYAFLSAAQLDKGDKAGAITTLTAYQKVGGENPELLSNWPHSRKKPAIRNPLPLRWMESILSIPKMKCCIAISANLWMSAGNSTGAVREFTAVLAMKPLDKGRRRVRVGAGLPGCGR